MSPSEGQARGDREAAPGGLSKVCAVKTQVGAVPRAEGDLATARAGAGNRPGLGGVRFAGCPGAKGDEGGPGGAGGGVAGVRRDPAGVRGGRSGELPDGLVGPGTWARTTSSLVSRPMANTQGPQGNHDPAGSTQMFRAFVDDGTTAPQTAPQAQTSSGPRVGLIIGIVVAVVVIAAVAWLAFK